MTVRTDSRRPGLPVVSSPRADAGCRRPGQAAARADAAWPAVAPGRCRPPSPRAGSGAVTVPLDAAAGPALTNERCAVPRFVVRRGGGTRRAQPRARREPEIKFTLGLLTGVQCAENVGTKFTQEMQKLQNSLLTV